MTQTDRSDQREFEALVRSHGAQVCAVAYAVLRDRARAQEVAQDAFLVAWRDRAKTKPNVRWICGIARNLARNAARRRRETPMTDDHATQAGDARDQLITREEAARAEAALASLPERYREAVALYYGGDESIEQVAAALGISQDSARQRVHRGRERLRDLLQTVETALRATRPTAAFTAACVAAWAAGKPAPAHAAAIPKAPIAVLGAGAVALAVGVAVVAGVSRQPQRPHAIADASPSTDPRAGLRRRFPASPRPLLPAMLPHGALALGPSASSSSPPTASPHAPPPSPPLVDLDFAGAPFVALMGVFRNNLHTPIWVAYDTEAKIDIDTHGQRPAIDVFDEVLDKAGATRVEVAAIQVVSGGRTDAAILGGEPVTLSFHDAPLNAVLDALEPKLGMPIGRLAPEVLPGATDMDGNPVVDSSPTVTLDAHGLPAGAALQQVLAQAGKGYELTTGFVVLPR